MQAYRLILLAGTLSVALMASACDVTTPSQINTSKIHVVKDQTVTEMLGTDQVDVRHVMFIARKVLRNSSNGEVALTVPYLPGGENRAADLGAAYRNAFAAQNVTHVSVALVAVTDSEEADKIVASYQTTVAKQAEDCGRIPGYEGTQDMDNYDNYQFGCETQAQVSQMVTDPADLLGKQNTTDANSRRTGAIIEPYMLGTPNAPMQGMSASSIGK